MNPADFGMFWMNQYAQADRMVMDDNTSYYAQPSIGMSVMDDISHQTNSMVCFFVFVFFNLVLEKQKRKIFCFFSFHFDRYLSSISLYCLFILSFYSFFKNNNW